MGKNLAMKKIVIFDLDGTLIDSAPTLALALNKTLKSLSKPTYPLATIRSWIGGGASVLVKRALAGKKEYEDINEELFQKALKIFLKNYQENLFEGTTLYLGVKEALEELKNNFTLTLATNKPSAFVKPILEYLSINYFETILGGDSVAHKKPHPQMLLEIIQKHSTTPKEAVMVGDSSNDFLAAQRAGIDFIGISYGYEELDGIKSLLELKEIL